MNNRAYKFLPFTLDRSRSGNLASQLASSLRQAIGTGYYKTGDVLPPVRAMSKLLCVSQGVAEQALSVLRDEGLVSPRPRIGSVVCAKDHPRWKGHVVIVVPPGRVNPFDDSVHVHLRDTLTAQGYLTSSVTVAETRPRLFNDFALLDTMLSHQTDLVVLLHDQDNIARWLSKRGTPFVRLTAYGLCPPNCRGVVSRDDYQSFAPFLEHCRKTAIRRVVQVMGFPCFDLSQHLGEAGVTVETFRYPRWRENGSGRGLADWAVEALSKRFAKEGKSWLPDLLFFNDDHLATGGLLALTAAGVRIPEDVRVATWSNSDYGPSFLKPLTRMEMDNAAISGVLADCVLDYLQTGNFPQGVKVGPKFILGETM